DQGNYNMSQRYTPVPNAKPSPMPEGMAGLRDDIVDDTYLDSLTELRKAGTFTILFDHTGQLVSRPCVCLPRLLAGPSVTAASFVKIQKSNDNIFCYPTEIPAVGLPLAADDMTGDASYHDYSLAGFYIYVQKELNNVPVAACYSGDFGPHAGDPSVEKILINIYTGSIIENEE
ncbi:MAG: hypothetical protein K9M57_03945, partial [Phycisphaerae bacterium]|nr:hypothetical protein [Phycisphaerae bacterium]